MNDFIHVKVIQNKPEDVIIHVTVNSHLNCFYIMSKSS